MSQNLPKQSLRDFPFYVILTVSYPQARTIETSSLCKDSMLPLFKQIEIFSGIPTVYFKCKHFPQYTRELLEGLLGISTSERNPCGGKKLTTYRTNTHRGLSSSFTVSWLKILVQFSYNFKRRSY